jgi:hypothetical protein
MLNNRLVIDRIFINSIFSFINNISESFVMLEVLPKSILLSANFWLSIGYMSQRSINYRANNIRGLVKCHLILNIIRLSNEIVVAFGRISHLLEFFSSIFTNCFNILYLTSKSTSNRCWRRIWLSCGISSWWCSGLCCWISNCSRLGINMSNSIWVIFQSIGS